MRQGKGFGGSHSATDSNYSWPDYGDLIGGYFDGHPWVQDASVDVEDPQSPLVAHAAPSFRFNEEFYQFRAFSRDNVRVLLTLDAQTVDLSAPGVHRTDGDFALAWVRNYGKGRVFYSAFGHFPESFTQEPIRTMLLQALLWLTGQIDLDATPALAPLRRPRRSLQTAFAMSTAAQTPSPLEALWPSRATASPAGHSSMPPPHRFPYASPARTSKSTEYRRRSFPQDPTGFYYKSQLTLRLASQHRSPSRR